MQLHARRTKTGRNQLIGPGAGELVFLAGWEPRMKAPKLKRILFDDGVLTGGFLTQDRTLLIEGKSVANAKITIFDNGVKIGTVKADKKGNWSFATKELADGSHGFTASAKLKKDKSKPSNEVKGTVDGTAPAQPGIDLSPASDTGTSNTDNLTADSTPTLTGTAEAGSTVTIRVGGAVLGTTVADGSGAWSFTPAAVGNGVHSFTATATDQAGNVGTSSSILLVTVDTAAPTATIVVADTALKAGETSSVTINFSEAVTGLGAEDFTVANAVLGGLASSNGGITWTATLTPTADLEDATNGITLANAGFTDLAGNAGTGTTTSNTYAIDTEAPAAPTGLDLAAADDSGTSNSDDLTRTTENLTISGSGVDGLVVTLFNDADNDGALDGGETVLGTDTVTGGVFSIDIDLAEGVHHVRAIQNDAAGNDSAASAALTITVDTSAPLVPGAPDLAAGSDSGASSTDNVTNVTTPTFTGTGAIGSTIRLKEGSSLLGTGIVDGSGNWSITSLALGAGDHTIIATSIDAAGNESGFATGITVTIDTAGPAPPTAPNLADASDTGPSDTDNVTSDTTPTFTGAAEAGATVRLYADGVNVGETVAVGGNWSITASTLAGGDYDITATAHDPAGNASAASPALSVTIDATVPPAPTAPVISGFNDDTGDPDDHVTLDEALVISGTADPGVTISVYDGTTLLDTTTANGAGVWSFTTDALDEGTHVFTATATDAESNTSPPSLPLAVRIGLDVDVASLATAWGFRIFGADAGDTAGHSVSSAGDINGDGYDDLVIGARGAEGAGDDHYGAGEAIIVFGNAGGFADIDAAALAVADGFRIFGGMEEGHRDWLGASVSSAGDINGDGFDDLIIGASQADNSGGAAIIIFGKGGDLDDIDLSEPLAPANGFRILADFNDFAGSSVSSAGDVNGDGYDDLMVGAPNADGPTNGRPDAGEAIVIFGKAGGFADLNVSTMAAADGFRIFGANGFSSPNRGDDAGQSVRSAGDVNGDGFDDLIIGAPYADGPSNTKVSAGEAIIVFGKAGGAGGGFANIDVNASDFVTSGAGFRIFGSEADDRASFSVSSAGDINGDGFDDLIVGAVKANGPANDRSLAGEAIIVFGKSGGFTNIDVSSGTLVSSGAGFRIFGGLASDQAGWSVASAGDVNGDGFDDLIVGAPGGDGAGDTRADAGEAIVIFGKASGFGDIDLASPLAPGAGFRVYGALAVDELGYSVSGAGDVNGDGFDDLIVGADQGDGPLDDRPLAGEAIVIFGGDFLGNVVNAGTAGDDTLTGTAGAETFVGGRGNDTMTGVGGADSFHGGAGNDTITVTDLDFLRVDGGSGVDTLRLDDAGATIDLTGLAGRRISGVEKLDLTGDAANALLLDRGVGRRHDGDQRRRFPDEHAARQGRCRRHPHAPQRLEPRRHGDRPAWRNRGLRHLDLRRRNSAGRERRRGRSSRQRSRCRGADRGDGLPHLRRRGRQCRGLVGVVGRRRERRRLRRHDNRRAKRRPGRSDRGIRQAGKLRGCRPRDLHRGDGRLPHHRSRRFRHGRRVGVLGRRHQRRRFRRPDRRRSGWRRAGQRPLQCRRGHRHLRQGRRLHQHQRGDHDRRHGRLPRLRRCRRRLCRLFGLLGPRHQRRWF